MRTIAIDFETYYDKEIGIKTLGLDPYVKHPKALPYLVSLYSENEAGDIDVRYVGPLETAPWGLLNGCRLVAHNARFDETVFLQHQGTLIPADCKPAEWQCTADLSVYLSAPRNLLGACKQLLQMDVSKTYRITALGKTWRDFTEKEREEIIEAGDQDARGAFLLWKHFHKHWPECERELSRINREMGRRGIRINVAAIDEAIGRLERELWEAGRKIPWKWGGERSKTPLLRNEIAMECRKEGIPCPSSFAEDSVEAQEWEETYGPTYPWINALKVWRNGSGFLAKLRHLRDRADGDIYSYTLKYFGAHTGRFSGDGGFNMQNIYRDERYGVNLRHMFIPRPGKKFLISDLSQIEARLLLWNIWVDQGRPKTGALAESLELIRQGLSVYEVHAIQTMGWDRTNGELKKANPSLYLLAKARVLALGYGCGAVKFQVMAHNLCGLDLPPAECKQVVADFRSNNPDICKHWAKLQSLLQAACRARSRTCRVSLPSGRNMEYFGVTAHDGLQAQTERGGSHYHYYGPKVEENIIQALGRDILRDIMLRCAKALPQHPIVLSVHDELVFEVPEDAGEETLQEVEAAMVELPEWAAGLPLGAESIYSSYYKK